jgi:Ca-activated chloride channel family protein
MEIRRAFLIRLSLAAMGLAVMAFWPLPAPAQITGPTAPGRSSDPHTQSAVRPIQIDVEMVLVDVTVADLDDRLVLGLQKKNFQLFENGAEQEILTFSQEEEPMSLGLLFDLSSSMADKIDESRRAALQMLKTANPEDEFFLVSFSDHAELTSGFTSDLNEVQSRMLGTIPKGHTALMDAIDLGLKEMRKARYRKRALIIISDGGDNHSRNHEARIRSELKEADSQVYAIGIYNDEDMKRSAEERKGPALLAELAELTGGRAFRVSGVDELPKVAAKINTELRSQYVLGYKPNGPHDGAWRNIKVKVTASPATPLRVSARSGYYSRID